MAPFRRPSNGRSPLVNQQSQITAFFSKSASSPPSSSSLVPSSKQTPKSQPNPKPNPKPKRSPSPSPTTPSPLQTKRKKPLLVIGPSPSPSPSPSTPEFPKKLYGKEVVNKRIRVYWPLDQSWYDGSVKSFDKVSGKHLIQYDDAEEELLDLVKEKVEWGEEQVPRKFRRLRRVSVIEDDEEEEAVANAEEVENDDDSTDEDWGKNVETQVAEDVSEEDMDMEDEDEDDDDEDAVASGERTRGKNSESRKRKTSGGGKFVAESKKRKSAGDAKKSTGKVTLDGNGGKLVVPKDNGSGNASHVVGDAAERFGMRETQKLRFLGQDRRDANRRRPGDVNYDPTTLYLPPDFVKSLSGGQRQWWEFKSKHMDKVLFFKMGKFYELFEMDAHVGAKELDLQYMKGYWVLVVEQTETPEQLELRRKEKSSKDKINLGIYMKDDSKEFSILVDRSVGGSSIVDGQLELMLHRRLLNDDSKGVAEALNETVCIHDKCTGLTVQGKYYLRIDPLGEGAKWRRSFGQEIYSPFLLAFTKQDGDKWTNFQVPTFSGMDPSYSLPENIAMITLQELEDRKVLLRLAHLYEVGEDKDLSVTSSVELKKMFLDKKINKITEMSLSANQEREKMLKKRLVWKVEGARDEEFKVLRGGPVNPIKQVVELAPMEIRTFVIDFTSPPA